MLSLIAWYNLPFLLAFGGGLLFALLQLVGGFGDHDASPDIDHDLDLAVDHDIDIDHEVPAHATAHFNLLTALGVGYVPLSLVLMLLLSSFGTVGLLLNTLLASQRYPAILFPVVLAGALVLAYFITAASSRVLGRVAPETSTAIRFGELVGRVGVVSSSQVSQTYGRVAVRDSHGSTHTVFAITDSEAPIPERSEVALVAYDEPQKRFLVRVLAR